jgi:ketopantoate reductase
MSSPYRGAALPRPSATARDLSTRRPNANLGVVTAKEKLLEEAPRWTDAQATAALRVVEAQNGLAAYFDEEERSTEKDLDAREDRWAEANAREAIREEPW